jgi:DNA-binding MarR family transcriptional regulator
MGARDKSSEKVHSVALVREFNRFYTQQIGVLQEGLLESAYSLTELRIMYELRERANTTASELAGLLGINHGYLSRILARFKSLGFIERKRSPADGRQLLLNLTSKGRRAYAPLDARASAEVELLLKDLSAEEVGKLLEAMNTIRQLLNRTALGRQA